MQRVGGPVAHYACRLPSETLLVLWQSLSVEHVALDNQGNDSEARVAPGRQGALPLFAEVQACSIRAQVSIGQIPILAFTCDIPVDRVQQSS